MAGGSDWEVGPVLKNKANSQGTLLRGGTKYSSPERYHRGYTPERLNEVREVTNSTNPWYNSDEAFTGPARREMVDNIARSTVPSEHLQRLQFNPGQANLDWKRPSSETESGLYTAGEYITENRTGSWARINMRKGEEGRATMIHEIGHHVSSGAYHPESDGLATSHSEYRTQSQQGQEEGFADEYAHEHFRMRGGKKHWRQQENTPESKAIYAGGKRSESRTDEFYDAYHAHRGTRDPDDNRITEEDSKRWAAESDTPFPAEGVFR